MDSKRFDTLTEDLSLGISRRRIISRLAKAGAGAALVAALGRTRSAAAQVCHHGANTCQNGYVWREAFPGDLVCVVPSQRDQTASDNY